MQGSGDRCAHIHLGEVAAALQAAWAAPPGRVDKGGRGRWRCRRWCCLCQLRWMRSFPAPATIAHIYMEMKMSTPHCYGLSVLDFGMRKTHTPILFIRKSFDNGLSDLMLNNRPGMSAWLSSATSLGQAVGNNTCIWMHKSSTKVSILLSAKFGLYPSMSPFSLKSFVFKSHGLLLFLPWYLIPIICIHWMPDLSAPRASLPWLRVNLCDLRKSNSFTHHSI